MKRFYSVKFLREKNINKNTIYSYQT